MIDISAWTAATAGLVGTAAAAINAGSLLRHHLELRAHVRMERERSLRSIARTVQLSRMVRHTPAAVRVLEVDRDGDRLIEIGLPPAPDEEAA